MWGEGHQLRIRALQGFLSRANRAIMRCEGMLSYIIVAWGLKSQCVGFMVLGLRVSGS